MANSPREASGEAAAGARDRPTEEYLEAPRADESRPRRRPVHAASSCALSVVGAGGSGSLFLAVVEVNSWFLLAGENRSGAGRERGPVPKRCSYVVFVDAVTPEESRRQS